ncbi:MAG: TspO/MBR family protein [Candidatus Doudnabacteria bacterium]
MKLNYIIIPLITALVALSGSEFVEIGLKSWYKRLQLPDIAPDGITIGRVWTGIYVLTAISVMIIWNSSDIAHSDPIFIYTIGLFVLNGVMNVFWNFLFFTLHLTGLATVESTALGLSVLALILLAYPVSMPASLLLLPYFAWVCFTTYLNYNIWELNK